MHPRGSVRAGLLRCLLSSIGLSGRTAESAGLLQQGHFLLKPGPAKLPLSSHGAVFSQALPLGVVRALFQLSRPQAGLAALSSASAHEEQGAGTARIRNVAIIAHVDHGKTTLVDQLLRQCGAAVTEERAMDSISLERERGITISSKYTSVEYRGVTLNLVDTPGHADFGGEVERVMGMVDGAVLLVDAVEGPLAQTKFVLAQALRQGLRPIVVLNKCDRPAVTTELLEQAESNIFDLFASFDATEEQLNFPVLYASGREGWAHSSWPPPYLAVGTQADLGVRTCAGNMAPLLDSVLEHVPAPVPVQSKDHEGPEPFRMLVSMVERDSYLGRLLVGRIASGSVRVGDRVHALRLAEADQLLEPGAHGRAGVVVDEGKVVKLVKRVGLERCELEFATAGDIVAIAGLPSAFVSHTVAHVTALELLPTAAIDPPTLSMTLSVNDSPLAGQHGTQVTGPKIGERLRAEAETNVSLSVGSSETSDSTYQVLARGELQLGILIENMRREGFELSISPPRVLYRTDERGAKLEPVEEVLLEVDSEYAGAMIEALSLRKGEILDMVPDTASGRTRLLFKCPSRGLLGFRGTLSTYTHGTGIMHRSFLAYEKFKGEISNIRRGVLVSLAPGATTAHALASLEARGTLFVGPGEETYDGHIIGENSRDEDMEVNAVRAKELSNVRTAGKDENIRLRPPRQMSLEEAMAYIAEDELVEVTPCAIRLRKATLSSSRRKTNRRTKHSSS